MGKAHGLKGEFYLHVYYDPDRLHELPHLYRKVNESYELLSGLSLKVRGNRVLAKLEGADSREELRNLGLSEIYIKKDELPQPDEGEYYYADLIGCQCIYEDKVIGVVADIVNHGSCDLFVLEGDGDKTLYIPFLNDLVKEIMLEEKSIHFMDLDGYI